MGDEEKPPLPKRVEFGRVLMVLTSTDKYPDETPCGYWLTEAAHPYAKWIEAGWTVDFARIGETSVPDPKSVEGAMDAPDAEAQLAFRDMMGDGSTTAKKLADLLADEESPVIDKYDVLMFCGGFGAVWDFPQDESVKAIAVKFWEADPGKVVCAICHGPLALVNVELGDGTKLLEGKECTAFANIEEDVMGTKAVVCDPTGPGTCEDLMTAAGGLFKVPMAVPDGELLMKPTPFAANVVEYSKPESTTKLITASNPPSAAPMAEAVIFALDPIKKDFDPPRVELLAQRGKLVKDLEEAKAAFTTDITPLKASNKLDDMDALQIKHIATRDWLLGRLATVDAEMERLAINRQMRIDEYVAEAAAAAVEEE